MLKTYGGLQSAKGAEATEFLLFRTTDSSYDTETSTIDSDAITGVEFAKEGIVQLGAITGNNAYEVSIPALTLALEANGFSKDDSTKDTVYKAKGVTVYPYMTIIQEFTDKLGKSFYKKFIDVVVNDFVLNLDTKSYVKATLTPMGGTGSLVDGEFTPTNLIADTGETLLVKESKISIGGTELSCETTTLSVDLNNNLTAVEVLCGSSITNKGGNRALDISYSLPQLLSTEYQAELTKAQAGTPIVVDVVLKTKSGDEVTLNFPRTTYSAITSTSLTGDGASDRTLSAKWDDTASTAMLATITGTGTGS